MASKSVQDWIVERLSPIYPVATEISTDVGSVSELLQRWWESFGNVGKPTNQKLFDRYVLAGAAGASLQDKAYDYWSNGLLASGIELPGTAGNYLSMPDSVLNSITGDLDIRVKATAVDWSPASTQFFLAKAVGGSQFSWQLYLDSTGWLRFAYSQNGTTEVTVDVNTALGFADNATKWVRFTLDVDNGSGQHVGTVYKSDDGITWTIVGSPATLSGVVAIFNGTALLTIGARDPGSSNTFDGTIHYAEIRNGIEGPIVAKFDPSSTVITGTMLPVKTKGWVVNGTGITQPDLDYLKLPGTAGNYISQADNADLTITSDLDVRVKLSLNDWTPGATGTIIGQYHSISNQRSWMMQIRSDGTLNVWLSTNGTGGVEKISTVVTGIPDGTIKYIRFTLDADNGAGGYDVKFYTSDNGITWTQLGATVTTATPITLFNSTTSLLIGAKGDLDQLMPAGNVYWAEVRNGIDGTVVARFDAREIATEWTAVGTGWSWVGTAPVPGDLVLDLTGTTSYVSTPDSAELSITGDIDIRAKATFDTWNRLEAIVGKFETGTTKSYLIAKDASGKLVFYFSADGSTTLTGCTTPALNFVDGVTKWVRATRVQATGVVNIYTSDDGLVWKLEDSETNNVGTAIADTVGALEIGRQQSTWQFSGKIHYVEVRNGINGPIVTYFDATDVAKTGTRLPTVVNQPGGTPNKLTPNQASLETDTTGWGVTGANTTIARSTAQFLDGVASLEITAVAMGTTRALTSEGTSGKPVLPGKQYTVVMNSRGNTVARSVKAKLHWYDVAGTYITSVNGAPITNSITAWTTVPSVSGVAPSNAAFAAVEHEVTDATQLASEVHYVDRVSLVESPTAWTVAGSAWDWESVAV